MQIQISWLLQKLTDLDLHSFTKAGISGFRMTRIKLYSGATKTGPVRITREGRDRLEKK